MAESFISEREKWAREIWIERGERENKRKVF